MAFKKGKAFEKETAEVAGKYGKRIPSSGAFGTTMGERALAGDVKWVFPWSMGGGKEVHIECKHGYDRSKKEQKSMTIYREWFDKHLTQAKALDFVPMFAFKFKFTQQNGMSKFVLIPFPVMEKLIKDMENMYLELEELRNEQAKRKATTP
jgi:hypothetical protein